MKESSKIYDMIVIAIFAVLMAVCSWISIPMVIPFTMQTFGLFLTLVVLGGKKGTMAILIFILLGAIGLPVFSGFTGGIGILMGNTGGYILGFILSCLLYWGMEKWLGDKEWVKITAMFLGMVTYYIFGTIWYLLLYISSTGPVGIGAVLSWCVIPFVVPDLVKMALANMLGKRLKEIMKHMK